MAAGGNKQLKALAASAAVYGLRKALSERASGNGSGNGNGESHKHAESSLPESVWIMASEKIIPVADDLAESLGKWVAQNAPEIVRERLIPRFIEAFQDAA